MMCSLLLFDRDTHRYKIEMCACYPLSLLVGWSFALSEEVSHAAHGTVGKFRQIHVDLVRVLLLL
jgi:hypothetical protein